MVINKRHNSVKKKKFLQRFFFLKKIFFGAKEIKEEILFFIKICVETGNKSCACDAQIIILDFSSFLFEGKKNSALAV